MRGTNTSKIINTLNFLQYHHLLHLFQVDAIPIFGISKKMVDYRQEVSWMLVIYITIDLKWGVGELRKCSRLFVISLL